MADIAFLKTPAELSLTGNPIPFRIAGKNAYTDGVLNANYSIGITPEADGDEIVTLQRPVKKYAASDGELPGDFTAADTGIIDVDIADLLREEKRGHYSFPTPKYFGANHSITKQFRLLAFEKSGYPPVEGDGIYSSYFACLQGKLGNFAHGELNYLGKSFSDKLRESGMFLTFAPLEKETDIYAPERLYFLFLVSGSFVLTVKQYYTDGTTATNNKESFFVNQYQVREFFVSYDKIRTNAPKKLVKYEVYLTDASNNIISETRTFILDYRYQGYARYFYFKNRLCVYELMRTTGKISKSRKIDKEFVKIPLSEYFTNMDREEKQISDDTTTTYEINSGYFYDKYWADFFQEFLLSDDVYWLKRGVAYPVTIQDSKQEISSDGEYVSGTTFNLTHSLQDDFTEEFTAQEPINVGDFNIDFNTDYFTGETGIIYEVVFDENFDVWEGGLPVKWQEWGDGIYENDNGRVKMTSPTGADIALVYPTSFMTKVLYRLSFTVDSISPFGTFFLRAGGFDTPLISAAGEYTYTFEFSSLYSLSNSFQVHFFSMQGVDNVNIIFSNIKLEYEFTELEAELLDENFDTWEFNEANQPIPVGWTTYGIWDANNYTQNDNGRFRITTNNANPNMYSLQRNFMLLSGETYRVTGNFEELSGFTVRFYVGNTLINTFTAIGEKIFEFVPTNEYFSFDLKFEASGANHTALINSFKIEKIS